MCKHAEMLLVWRRSRCSKIFDDLEVGYVGFIINACVGA
jgi:hypothetical protein